MHYFWTHGYDRSDVASIAASIGVTKPCLYQLFGDKEHLFLRALQHYADTVGAAPVIGFLAAKPIEIGVAAFFDIAIRGHTEPGRPSGCLLACVAATCAETNPHVKRLYCTALSATATRLMARFDEHIAAANLPPEYPSAERATLMVDLVQAVALRARAGVCREELLITGRDYSTIVLSNVSTRRPRRRLKYASI
jgi:AcrR family transcriptional regulator